MIIILKREDLPPVHRELSLEELELDHSLLSPAVINQADLIVFVEGKRVKFLKQHPGLLSPNSFDILLSYWQVANSLL